MTVQKKDVHQCNIAEILQNRKIAFEVHVDQTSGGKIQRRREMKIGRTSEKSNADAKCILIKHPETMHKCKPNSKHFHVK
jgi:hypothetical protein